MSVKTMKAMVMAEYNSQGRARSIIEGGSLESFRQMVAHSYLVDKFEKDNGREASISEINKLYCNSYRVEDVDRILAERAKERGGL